MAAGSLMKSTTSHSARLQLNLKTIIQSSLRSEGETRQGGTGSLRKRGESGEEGCRLNLDLYFLTALALLTGAGIQPQPSAPLAAARLSRPPVMTPTSEAQTSGRAPSW